MTKSLALLLSAVLAGVPASAQVVGRVSLGAPSPGALGTSVVPTLTTDALQPAALSGPSLSAVLAPSVALPPEVSAVRAVTALKPAALAAGRPPRAASKDGEPFGAKRPEAAFKTRAEELKAAFDEKTAEETPVVAGESRDGAALTPASREEPGDASDAPPVPSPTPRLAPMARPLVFFLGAVVLAQVGIEAQNAALPPLIAKAFGDVSVAADVGVAASVAYIGGTILAPLSAKSAGLKAAYVWSTGLRMASGGLVAGLLAAGLATMPVLMAAVALDAVLYGVSFTLEKSIPAVMLDQDQRRLERYKALRQTWIEGIATFIPIATGAVIASAGFLPAIAAFPVAMVTAATLVALTLRLPRKIAGAKSAPLPGLGQGGTLSYLKHLARGARVIGKTPALLYSLLAYSLVITPLQVVYWFLAPAYALRTAGGDPAHAAAYAGMITGLYSFGSVGGALLMVRQRDGDPARLRRSMLAWTLATSLGLLCVGVLALPPALFGSVTVAAVALMAFGVPETVARIKLESYFQSRAPKWAVDDATAVLEGVSSAVIALGLWWAGHVLAGAAIGSFWSLTLAAAPLAAALSVLVFLLRRAA